MSIFSQNKTVVGLFDNDQAVEKAVKSLQAHNFGNESDQEIKIIDQHRLPQEKPVSTQERFVTANIASAGQRGTVSVPSSTDQADVAVFNVQSELSDRGFEDETAKFFAEHVSRGNKLVIVDTDDERVGEALEALQQPTNAGRTAAT